MRAIYKNGNQGPSQSNEDRRASWQEKQNKMFEDVSKILALLEAYLIPEAVQLERETAKAQKLKEQLDAMSPQALAKAGITVQTVVEDKKE